MSFRAAYEREVSARLAAAPVSPLVSPLAVTGADLEQLPGRLRRYLQVSGSVGQPRVHHVRAAWRGRIRRSPQEPWMAFTAEQHDFVDEPARFFLMRAKRGGLPVHVYHAYHGPDVATMRARLLGLIPLVDEAGADLRRAETVTLFNDLCLLAPGALVDPRIRWDEIDAHRVRGHYTSGQHVVAAELVFNEAGELVDWLSDDRLVSTDDGLEPRRWSTPVTDVRAFGPLRLASRGAARWHTAEGPWTYIELELVAHEINGRTVR